ncbi:MAG: hypothetical protein HN778_13700 [Prolixibacteraceae bacterium]|jgi:hypothetical protein|nr:hypothetical protein [Prolixibacteraceae bacterium]MBT6762947.1 hypothetical protein [Prolixibacteraceae bacterium]MBT6999490.1 hypothetical protein [Prolixibacteraceae bacterium]MBT7395880.1 hypothetical protein [Prolixibacteraceae bacterium]
MIGKKIKYIVLVLLIGATTEVAAQRDTTLSQEVEVFKAYKPSISDADKINEMPKIDDAEHQKPTFNYSIFSQPIYNTFSVNTLKAATIASKPKQDTGYGLVRAGLGNYNKPYGEFFFNTQNTKNTIFGLHGMHLSSLGKLRFEGDNRVDAPFSENGAEMFIKHLFRNSVLSVNLNFDHNGFNYYGYPVDSIPTPLNEENQNINYIGTKQAFSKGGININLVNSTANKNDPTFGFNFLYHYFGTKTDQREHFGQFTADVKKPMNIGVGLLEAGASFIQSDQIFNRNLLMVGKSQQTWLTAKPAYYLGNDVANIRAGFNAWFVLDNDIDIRAKIAPNVRVNFAPVKEIINIFAGVDGNYINNHYSKIAYENPFVDPQHDVKNSFEKLHFYGGFDGKFATKTNFKIAVDYSMINDQPLYYLFKYIYPTAGPLPSPSIIDNDFDVLYDNLDLLKFNLEIFHTSSEKLDLLISGNYYVYKLETQDEAWNLPDWDAKLSLAYKITEQLSVSSDIFLVGKRNALIIDATGFDPRPIPFFDLTELPFVNQSSYNLSTAIDLNFAANYKITQKFSVFAQLNNFGFQKYQRWFGYPVQSFNFLGGLSYAF